MSSHRSTKTLVREMHTALVGAEATELEPHPPPGLVDRVGSVERELEAQRPLLERVGTYLDTEGVPPSPARRGPPAPRRVAP